MLHNSLSMQMMQKHMEAFKPDYRAQMLKNRTTKLFQKENRTSKWNC